MLIPLKENERLIRIIRRYGLTYFWWFWLIFLLIATPFFFIFWLFARNIWGPIVFVLALALGLLLLIRLFYFWHRNALVITTERVVDVFQAGSLNRTVTEIPYDKIHNISYQIKGLAPTVFRYGKIKIQTMAGNTDLEFSRVKNPARAQEIISAAREAFSRREGIVAGKDAVFFILDKINQLSKEDLTALLNVIQSRLKNLS